MNSPKKTPEEKNRLRMKAFEIVKEIKDTKNIFMPENAELKAKLIAELESIVTNDTQEKIKNTLNCPILFVGDVYKSMLAGCYAHCVREIKFMVNFIATEIEEGGIKAGLDINEYLVEIESGNEIIKQTPFEIMKDILGEEEGRLIYKDCFGQPLEKLWYGDDPAYCHTSVLNPNRYAYTQHTGIQNWLENYRLGTTLFLVCLEGEDSRECKEFVKNIREMTYPKTGIPRKLIVHTNDINKLPEYFSEPFEVIELEPDKQGKSGDIPQGNPESKRQVKDNVFRWAGGTWEITYGGKTMHPQDSKGLIYIHHLIKNENKEFYALDLMNVTSSIQSEENKQVLLRKGTQVENDELDERLKDSIPPKQLKQSLKALEQKLENAETQEEREDIQGKIDKITERLEVVKGEDSANKARIAVYNAMNRALEKIKKEHSLLYEHFNLSIDTGISFKYKPTNHIHWTFN